METLLEPMKNTAIEARPAGALAVRDMAARIAREAPELEALTPEQLEAVARAVVGQRLAEDLRERSDMARLDYATERETFLSHAGKNGSPNTRRAYAAALDRLDAYAAFKGQQVPAMKPRDADDFGYHLATEGRASASIRRDMAAASSFLSFLARRYDFISNPFRGTPARPEKRATKAASFPTDKELAKLLPTLPPDLRAAATVMAYRGLRVGALPSLSIRGDRFTARSKGKDITGELPAKTLEAIRAAGLDARRPFEDLSETVIADRFRRATRKLAAAGTIAAAYSAHDLRHAYAVREYRKDKDLLRVKGLLNHASVTVTELYLKGIGEL